MKALRRAFLLMVVLSLALVAINHWHEHRHDNNTYLEQLEHIVACAEWNLYKDSALGYEMYYPSCFMPARTDSDEEGTVRYVYVEDVTPLRSVNYMTLEVTTEVCGDTLNPYREIRYMAEKMRGICLQLSPTEYLMTAQLKSNDPRVTAFRMNAKYVLRQRLWFVETFIYPKDFSPAVQRIVQKVNDWQPFPPSQVQ
ncbi:MAG: hypothetical protein J6Y04_08765 [Bacteroidaceae bacterium]|nr:hypothetical protein [Bacteroidaceae bacterium]